MLAKAAILGPRSQGDLCRTPGRKFGVDSVDTTMLGVCEHLLNEVRSYVYPLLYCIVYIFYVRAQIHRGLLPVMDTTIQGHDFSSRHHTIHVQS